uniref:Oxidation resistance protein 1 n=1 Tax=Mucochytrium quahogii TaxID=96639 RepID=A0A7S2SCG6_9STRA|mmetsp:Transcript_11166/g.18233  ORF Transcript_11166/g.18233 Transcript_11166/m.18233 type:complete len:308 (-) Transcript_11166:10-933(-)|eukprot:CAMPEP_0203746788 /NCGR_PEP_ID=MMETSP0098-20131031/2122_1 /ASSEMBLY_ACC=CAM_ASM_000208 /TAXON_ID=96639 /ORGANISM=" , Strain NY0313808BC1" /LENGTH=307 /DNA_ID=CAMNT_0050635007 /DNA_START=249 /DNA_END=1172 /DNA_ORIENTATION=-
MGNVWCSCCEDDQDDQHREIFLENGDTLDSVESIEPLPLGATDNVRTALGGTNTIHRAVRNRRNKHIMLLKEDESNQSSPFPQTPPKLSSGRSLLLKPLHMLELRRSLPRKLRRRMWKNVYSLEDGASLQNLNKKLAGLTSCLFVVKINDGSLIGALLVVPSGWSDSRDTFFGSDGFLFRLPPCDACTFPQKTNKENRQTDSNPNVLPKSNVFRSTGSDSMFVRTTPSEICFGSGGGLWLDQDLSTGGSGPCSTFGLESSLSPQGFFDVVALEVWSFNKPGESPVTIGSSSLLKNVHDSCSSRRRKP